MALSNTELLRLVDEGLKYELPDKETNKLLKALCKKFLTVGLDSFKARLLLSAHLHFEKRYDSITPGNRKARREYITNELIKWRSSKV